MTGHSGPATLAMPRYTPPPGDTEPAAIQRDYLRFLGDVTAHCGDIGTYLRHGQPVVLVNSPVLARELLIDKAGEFTKGDLQQTTFRALLGESISLSDGGRHRMLRRLLAPLLTRRQVSRYANRIITTAEAFCAAWPLAGMPDLFSELHRLTLHTLGRTLIADNDLWDERGQFWQHRQRLWEWIVGHAAQGRRLASHAAAPTDAGHSSAIADLQAITDDIIARRMRSTSQPVDLLADIMAANRQAGNPLSLTQVRDQVLALLFAAHETSACALFWSLYLLDRNPHCHERLERVLATVLGSRAPSVEDALALSYTSLVLKEAMRLYPPAGRQFRVAAVPTALGGHLLPAGTPVSLCQYLLHRRPGSFPDPHRFDPQRFSTAASIPSPMAYLPFGAGERICLGRHYAALETQLLLAFLVVRFRFRFPDPVPASSRSRCDPVETSKRISSGGAPGDTLPTLSATAGPVGRVAGLGRRRYGSGTTDGVSGWH